MNLGKSHLTHYKKIKLNKDISLRYFFTFEDRLNLNGKWVIKSHSTKEYGIIDERTARLIATAHNKTLDDYKEIMGRYVANMSGTGSVYRKVIISNNEKKDKAKFTYEPNVKVTEIDKSQKTKE